MSVTATAEKKSNRSLFRQMRFDDNNRLSSLVGVHDENLTLLEEMLDVSVIHRGSCITVMANDCAAAELAISVLADFYTELQKSTHQANLTTTFNDFARQRIAAPFSAVNNNTDQIADQYSTLYAQSRKQEHISGKSTRANPEQSPEQLPEQLMVSSNTHPSLPGIGIGSYQSVDGLISVQTPKLLIKARNQNQHDYLCAIRDATMVFGIGAAGTGKTFLAVAIAVTMLQRGEIDRIVLTRPAREAGENLGFLPGDIADKLDPYLRPIHDALEEMLPSQTVAQYVKNRQIEIAPLAYMRGRTLKRAMVILDEAQNTTTQQMLMFLTRLGEGSKMVINGDPNQIDLPKGQMSGLIKCTQCLPFDDDMRLIRYHDRDIVRHPLIQRIVASFAEPPSHE